MFDSASLFFTLRIKIVTVINLTELATIKVPLQTKTDFIKNIGKKIRM